MVRSTAIRSVLPLFLFLISCEYKRDNPPNILFILVDDLGYHDLSFSGSSYYETPNIDKLAAQSYVFTQGYSACRVCSPSRASILSGQFTATHGITDWIGAPVGDRWNAKRPDSRLSPPSYREELDTTIITIPELLKSRGYNTFFAGKWHLGGEGSLPEDHGFDINVGGYHAGSPKGGYFAPFDNPKLPNQIPASTNLSQYLADRTRAFISSNSAEQPFFAMLSFYAVHGPIQTNQQKWKKYREKAAAQGIKESGFREERVLPIRVNQDNPVYAGLVEQMDEAVGRVMATLDSLGLWENTIVIFTSDNGGVASGDAYSTSNSPLRGGKGYQWEGGVAVPFFIKTPSMVDSVQIHYPVSGVDFLPTISDFTSTDFSTNNQMEGVSLVPLMGGEVLDERPLFWHYPHYGNQGGEPSSMVRLGNWKLIHYWEDDRKELYDLSDDPSERTDVSELNAGVVLRLDDLLQNWLIERKALYPEPFTGYNEVIGKSYGDQMMRDRLIKLEENRLEMLSPSYQPNPDWWGSE